MSRWRAAVLLVLVLLCLLPSHSSSGSAPAMKGSSRHCPPLSPPAGKVVTVSDEVALRNQAHNAEPGITIMIGAGLYDMQGFVHVVNDGITLRGETGDRGDVILDFGGMVSATVSLIFPTPANTTTSSKIPNYRCRNV